MLLMGTAPAADAVKEATARGVAFLRKTQEPDGSWLYRHEGHPHNKANKPGATALAGLTLLECGVGARDPAVEKAAAAVRKASISCRHTYSLSLAIMFLDRLGDVSDEHLIQSMAVRLIAGQNGQGGWTYECPGLNPNEQRWLSTHKSQQNELRTKADPADNDAKTPVHHPIPRMSKEIQAQLARMSAQMIQSGAARAFPADNSNTQFATLALWVARRHGVPVESSLERVAARFRRSQAPDGSWHYTSATSPGREGSGTPSMTCAGLLALAAGRASSLQAVRNLDRGSDASDSAANQAEPAANSTLDLTVRAGLIYLSTYIGPPGGGEEARAGGVLPDYYFFWSLERVAVIFGLKEIGRKDWYAWGSEILVARQSPHGSWEGYYPGVPDTCFALLFLRQANVARDLTAILSGRVQDPGNVQLKAGGVGAEALIERGTKSEAPAERPPAQEPPAKLERPGQPDDKPAANRTPKPADDSTPKPRPTTPMPENTEEKEAAELAQRLLEAPEEKQAAILETLKGRKGVAYTEALAQTITQLKGANRVNARDALAERLTRMTAATLREKLHDGNVEIRRAAALACAMKEERSFIPDLIGLLEDAQRPVSSAAHAALKALTTQDFGPPPNANRTEQADAVSKWKEWWKRQRR